MLKKILESSWALITLWLEAEASLDRSVLPFVGVPSQEPAGEGGGFVPLLDDYNGGPLIPARRIRFNIAFGRFNGFLSLSFISVLPNPDKNLLPNIQQHDVIFSQIILSEFSWDLLNNKSASLIRAPIQARGMIFSLCQELC